MASTVQYDGMPKPSAPYLPLQYGQPYSYEGAHPSVGQSVAYPTVGEQYAGQPYSYGNAPMAPPVTSQPYVGRPSNFGCAPPDGEPSQWQTGLCGCFEDPATCFITCCLPCITFGRISEILDEGQTSCPVNGLIYCALAWIGCPCIYACTYRSKLRAKYGLPEAPCNDCCVHYCCEFCALCQEYRELSRRGIDPALGWAGNKDVLTMTVPPHQVMNK